MIATIIVVGSIVLAAAYAVLWWLRPSLRREIEAPSRQFAADAKRYDSACRKDRQNNREQGESHD